MNPPDGIDTARTELHEFLMEWQGRHLADRERLCWAAEEVLRFSSVFWEASLAGLPADMRETLTPEYFASLALDCARDSEAAAATEDTPTGGAVA